jgi:signal recognition particle GTPase
MTYRTTVSLEQRHEEQIEQQQAALDSDDPGTSEAVRAIFDRAGEADELGDQVDELCNRVDELRDQLAAANTRIDATNELVQYVEHERELESRRAWREEQQAKAGVVTRTKWALVGMPDPPDEAEP